LGTVCRERCTKCIAVALAAGHRVPRLPVALPLAGCRGRGTRGHPPLLLVKRLCHCRRRGGERAGQQADQDPILERRERSGYENGRKPNQGGAARGEQWTGRGSATRQEVDGWDTSLPWRFRN